tara:strand:- start:12861 stop:13352 length:492 start_codon:yes stop_codon:yes gene_type:complete
MGDRIMSNYEKIAYRFNKMNNRKNIGDLKEHFFEMFKLHFAIKFIMEETGVNAFEASRYESLNFSICQAIFLNHAMPFYKLGGNPTTGYANRLKGKEHECIQICNSTGVSSASHRSQLADFSVYAVNWINDAWRERTTDIPDNKYLEKLNKDWIEYISTSELV